MPTALPYGNFNKLNAIEVQLSPFSVPATTSIEQVFALPGVALGDVILSVTKPTHQDGLTVTPGRVPNAGTFTLVFSNATAAAILPTAAQRYVVTVGRVEGKPNAGQMS